MGVEQIDGGVVQSEQSSCSRKQDSTGMGKGARCAYPIDILTSFCVPLTHCNTYMHLDGCTYAVPFRVVSHMS